MLTVIFMTVTGKKIKHLVMVSIFIITAQDTKVNGSMIINMAMASKHGSTVVNIKGTTSRVKKMDKVNIHGKMAVIIMVTGWIIK